MLEVEALLDEEITGLLEVKLDDGPAVLVVVAVVDLLVELEVVGEAVELVVVGDAPADTADWSRSSFSATPPVASTAASRIEAVARLVRSIARRPRERGIGDSWRKGV